MSFTAASGDPCAADSRYSARLSAHHLDGARRSRRLGLRPPWGHTGAGPEAPRSPGVPASRMGSHRPAARPQPRPRGEARAPSSCALQSPSAGHSAQEEAGRSGLARPAAQVPERPLQPLGGRGRHTVWSFSTTPGTPPSGPHPGRRGARTSRCRNRAWGPEGGRTASRAAAAPPEADFPSLFLRVPPSLAPPPSLLPAGTGHAEPPLPGPLPLGGVASRTTSGLCRLGVNVPLRERMAADARRGPGPRGAAVRAAVMLLLCLGVPTGRPYNVDTESALLYQGPRSTLFGYSVVLHGHGRQRW